MHVGKDVEEADHCIPEPAVGQALLVPSAGALNILCEGVKDLLCYLNCFGEIPLSLFINDVFPRIIPIEITD